MAKIRLTRRSVLVAVVAVGLVAASTGIGTIALSRDQEQSVGNTIQGGTADLSVTDSASLVVDDSSESLEPGASIGGNVTLSNTGSRDGTVDLNVTYTENGGNESTDASADETAKMLKLTALQYGGSSILEHVSDEDGDGTVTLYDLAQSEVDVGTLDPGERQRFRVTLTMNESANVTRSDGLSATFTVTATSSS